jgi:AcrR family transcriptional regulator
MAMNCLLRGCEFSKSFRNPLDLGQRRKMPRSVDPLVIDPGVHGEKNNYPPGGPKFMPEQKPNIAAISSHAKPALQQRSRRSLDRLVRAASRVLRRDGFEALTMAAVAAEAGASVGGIYRRFRNKQGLLLAIHDWLVSDIETAIREKVSGVTDLRTAVRSFVEIAASRMSADEQLFKMVFKFNQSSDEQVARARKAIQGCYQIFREAVLAHQDDVIHGDVEVAIAIAFHLAYASIVGRIGKFAEPPFSLMPWPVLQREVSNTVLTYLTGQPVKK